jgi:hypothetical protein
VELAELHSVAAAEVQRIEVLETRLASADEEDAAGSAAKLAPD